MSKLILFLLIVLTLFMFVVGFQQVAETATRDLDSPDNLMDKDEGMSGLNSEWSFVELQKGKQKATMIAIKSISNAIRSYKIDHNKAPEAKTFAELQPILSPRYIKTLPLKDAWGNDFHYYHGTGDRKDEYAIGSGGNDGVFNGWGQSGFYWVTTVSGFDNDFILANGRFVYGPVTKPGTTKPPAPPPKTFEGRLRVTMGDMFTIGKALRYYIEDYNQAPKVDSIKELSKILQPFYIKTLPLADAWENEILYKVDPENPKNYWIASPGSDGKFEGFDQEGTWKFEEGEKGQDIVLANGDFTYMPNLEEKKKK
ncbi:MAG: type II secretion system protein GspG [Candidatus Aminicenantes bacterium]|nr:MAG: type II secretion system protein GspG [Candidatus Aminicenantes bacterium]